MYSLTNSSSLSARMKISFRPHHFLCTLGFQGMGYSPGFIQNYTNIVEALQENDELPIEVVAGLDSICAPCPHNGHGVCKTEDKIQHLDTRHSQILEIMSGDVLTWKEAQERLKEKMSIPAFRTACEGCQWQAFGVCEAALRALREER